MANTATNVSASKPAVGGAISNAVLVEGLTIPTSTSAALTGFNNLGYVSEDGVTNSNSPASEDIKAWGGDTVLNTQTEKADTFAFKLIEVLNENVLKTVYTTGNVSTGEGGETVIKANASEMEASAWVIDMFDKIPSVGELFKYNDMEVEVVDADEKIVNEIKITFIKKEEEKDE